MFVRFPVAHVQIRHPCWTVCMISWAVLESVSEMELHLWTTKCWGLRCCKAREWEQSIKALLGQLSKILDSCNTVFGSDAGFFPFIHFFSWQMNCCRLWKSSTRGLLSFRTISWPVSKPRCSSWCMGYNLVTSYWPQMFLLKRSRSHSVLAYVCVRLEWICKY